MEPDGADLHDLHDLNDASPPGHVPPATLLVPPVPPPAVPGQKIFQFGQKIVQFSGKHPGTPAQPQCSKHGATRSVKLTLLKSEEIFLFELINLLLNSSFFERPRGLQM